MSKRICPRDGHVSQSLTEHLIHVTEDHDHSTRRLRLVSCYRCAAEIDVNETTTCGECGYALPTG